jgi:Flp pilus assembly protein TadD
VTPPTEVEIELSPAEALLAREDARRLLEKGAGKDAIVAGRASVALDPTDAEAWLVLGAAYQLVGHWQEARSAFQSCMRLATRGPTAECSAL